MTTREARHSRASRPALAVALAAALAATLGAVLPGGPAMAQDPVYDIPTPTPTPTPAHAPPAPPAGAPGRPRLDPFPTVRPAGSFARRVTRFTSVIVRAPAGASIHARCTRRRCRPFRRTLAAPGAVRLRGLQRSYPAGTRVTIRITAPAAIGKYVAIRTRRARPPVRSDLCLLPGNPLPIPCRAL